MSGICGGGAGWLVVWMRALESNVLASGAGVWGLAPVRIRMYDKQISNFEVQMTLVYHIIGSFIPLAGLLAPLV